MTNVLQGTLLPKIKGQLFLYDAYKKDTTTKAVQISKNETLPVVVGAFVKRDITVTKEYMIQLAGATTPKENLLFVYTDNNLIDRAIDGSSQGNLEDFNGGLKVSRTIIEILGNAGTEANAEVNDAVNIDDLLMIDDTDTQKARLIPFVDANGNIAIAKAVTPSTQAGEIIRIKFI